MLLADVERGIPGPAGVCGALGQRSQVTLAPHPRGLAALDLPAVSSGLGAVVESPQPPL